MLMIDMDKIRWWRERYLLETLHPLSAEGTYLHTVCVCVCAGEGGGLCERGGARRFDAGHRVHGNSLRHVRGGGQRPHDQPADHM